MELEKEMATHSSILAWRIPGMGEPGGLPSMGSDRVGYDWSDLAAAAVVQASSHVRHLPLHGLQWTRLHCPSLSPGVCSHLCSLSLWYYPIISSIALFSSPQSWALAHWAGFLSRVISWGLNSCFLDSVSLLAFFLPFLFCRRENTLLLHVPYCQLCWPECCRNGWFHVHVTNAVDRALFSETLQIKYNVLPHCLEILNYF